MHLASPHPPAPTPPPKARWGLHSPARLPGPRRPEPEAQTRMTLIERQSTLNENLEFPSSSDSRLLSKQARARTRVDAGRASRRAAAGRYYLGEGEHALGVVAPVAVLVARRHHVGCRKHDKNDEEYAIKMMISVSMLLLLLLLLMLMLMLMRFLLLLLLLPPPHQP